MKLRDTFRVRAAGRPAVTVIMAAVNGNEEALREAQDHIVRQQAEIELLKSTVDKLDAAVEVLKSRSTETYRR